MAKTIDDFEVPDGFTLINNASFIARIGKCESCELKAENKQLQTRLEAAEKKIEQQQNCITLLNEACKSGVAPNVIQEYMHWLTDRIKAPNLAIYQQQLKGLHRILERTFEASEKYMQAIAKAEQALKDKQ